MNTSQFNMNSTMGWSLGAIVIIAILLMASLPTLVGAAIGNGGGDLDVAAALDTYMTEADASLSTYQARFNGRAPFYTPLPTPKPPKIERPRAPATPDRPERKPDPTPRAPTIPSSYTGPSIMAIYGDEVWFTGSVIKSEIMRIKVGTEQSGIEVVTTDPPWSASLKYMGGEFEVPLFKLNDDLFINEAMSDTPPPGLIEEPPPTTTDKPEDPEASPPKSPADPADKEKKPSSTTGNGSPAGGEPGRKNLDEDTSDSPPGHVLSSAASRIALPPTHPDHPPCKT